MKQLIKDVLAQTDYMLYMKKIKKSKIQVHTVGETIQELICTEKSMVRCGDGEITVIAGKNLKL